MSLQISHPSDVRFPARLLMLQTAALTNPQIRDERSRARENLFNGFVKAGAKHHWAELLAHGRTTPLAWARQQRIAEIKRELFGDMQSLFGATPLPKDSERILENEVIEVSRTQRSLINDLISRGLTRSLPDIGVYTTEWHKASNISAATIGMELAGTRPDTAKSWSVDGVPIPIIQNGFNFDDRQLMASARSGVALDTSHAVTCAETVAELEESTAFAGASVTYGGYTIAGLTNHSNRITGSASGDFGTLTNVPLTIRQMIAAAAARNQRGRFGVYVATTQYHEGLAHFTDGSGDTGWDRVLRFPEIEYVREAPQLTAGHVVMIRLSRSTLDLAIAQNTTTVPWEEQGGALRIWRVFSSMVLRLKPDSAATPQLGVVHYTGA